MPNYYLIGIDATGTFDQTRMSRIGGVVLKNCSRDNLQARMQAVCDDHHYPGLAQDLERLHYTDAKNEKKKIETENADGVATDIPQATRVAIIQDMLARSQDVCALYFISTGFPHFFSHEQDTYFSLLRTTLWGLLTNQAFPVQSGDRLIINITTRYQSVGIYGTWQVHNDDYYPFIAKQLEREFQRVKEEKGLSHLEFRFGSGKYDAELILADHVVGNSRAQGDQRQPLSYLEIPFDDYCHLLIGTGHLDSLVADCKDEKIPIVATLFILLHLYAVEKNATTQDTIKTYLAELLDKVNGKELLQQEFLKTLESTLQRLMTNRAKDQQSLTIAQKYCDVILDVLAKKGTGVFFLRFRDIIYRYSTTIARYQGAGPVGIQRAAYHQFFEKYNAILYPTILERVKYFLDTELQLCQVLYFNVYDFQGTITAYSDYAKIYHKMLPPYIALSSDENDMFSKMVGKKDGMLGKIFGTLGQAHAFLYSILHQDADYETAKLYLEADTDQFLPGMFWAQGMHYRVHLELCKGNLASAWNMLKEILGNPPLPPESAPAALVRWMIEQKMASLWDISLSVKFLGYCKHADHTKNASPAFSISRQDWQALLGLVQPYWSVYPKCNILKWMAYLAVNTETKSAALDKEKHEAEIGLAQEALDMLAPDTFDTEEFTIQTMQIPLLMLRAWLKSEHPKQELQRLQDLMSQQPGFRACMKEYGWETKFPGQTTKNWNLWDIIVLLPYYYA